MSTALHLLAVHARRRTRIVDARAHFVAALDVDVFDVEGVDVPGEVSGGDVLARRCGGVGGGVVVSCGVVWWEKEERGRGQRERKRTRG